MDLTGPKMFNIVSLLMVHPRRLTLRRNPSMYMATADDWNNLRRADPEGARLRLEDALDGFRTSEYTDELWRIQKMDSLLDKQREIERALEIVYNGVHHRV